MKGHSGLHKTLLFVGMGLSVLSPAIALAQGVQSAGPQAWKAPERATRMRNPVKSEQRSIADAKKIYVNECLVCHGPSGKGDGSKAPDLSIHPGDLSGLNMAQQSDGELFWKITRGKTPMPAYRAKFSENQRWAMVNYLRTLADRSGGTRVTNEQQIAQKTTESPTTSGPQPAREPLPMATAPPGEDSQYVSRAEHQKLKADYETLRQEIDALKARVGGSEKRIVLNTSSNALADSESAADEVAKELEEVRDQARQSLPGSTKFLLTGFASAGFTSKRQEDSAFSANFAPLFLWKLSDQLLFESELDVTLEGNETEFDLKRAQISYLINDYITFGAGKFLSPMNFLEDRLHQVTKLPDKPLAIQRLLPESNIGLQLRGGIPIGSTRLGYAFYVANAPTIDTQNQADLGALQFDNFSNAGGHIAVGGRVGFYPIPELEIGYGFQSSGLGGVGQDTDALLHSIDLNYVRDTRLLKGTLNLLAQWVWSQVDSVTFDPDGSLGFGPVTFNNRRDGGYDQLAYRPTMIRNRLVSRFEPVVRYERFNQKRTAAGFNEQRWTLGLNYWLRPNAVVKVAYQLDDRSDSQDQDAFLVQFKVGY